jgi:hypothetical protein
MTNPELNYFISIKSPVTTSLRKQLKNHRTPMKIKYCEINPFE